LEATGADISGAAALVHDYEGKPTAEELTSLRRVADSLPTVAYVLCFAELCERASYYGTANVIGNFVNRKLPPGGNGGGAPSRESVKSFGNTGKSTGISASACVLTLFYSGCPGFGTFQVQCSHSVLQNVGLRSSSPLWMDIRYLYWPMVHDNIRCIRLWSWAYRSHGCNLSRCVDGPSCHCTIFHWTLCPCSWRW